MFIFWAKKPTCLILYPSLKNLTTDNVHSSKSEKKPDSNAIRLAVLRAILIRGSKKEKKNQQSAEALKKCTLHAPGLGKKWFQSG